MKHILIALMGLLLPAISFADPQFNLITSGQFDDLTKEFSANFMHHSVQGAAALGDIFGFQVGLIGGETPSPAINDISKQAGGASIDNIYHAGLLGVVSVPFGITGELIYLPKTTISGASAEMTSLAVKWTLNTDLLKVIPFNLALRGFLTNSKFSFDQTVLGQSESVEDKDTVTGLQILASPNLPIVEPYAGIGFVSAKNTLSSSNVSVFDPSYTTELSKDNNQSTTQFLLGATVKLLVLDLGLEYSNAFGQNSYTAKLAFGF